MVGSEIVKLHGCNPTVVVCANKIDLDTKRIVDSKDGLAFAETISAMYIETSAKTGHNVKESFQRATQANLDSEKKLPDTSGVSYNVRLTDKEVEKTRICCDF